MSSRKPHYLLFCDGNHAANTDTSAVSNRGKWRFVLENVESGERIEANDQELSSAPDRIALMAVLRGLEALEQPSRVTLVTTSRYVSRGLQNGLTEWRENDYSWEHFGTVQPIRNSDLWKRIDRALTFHQVQCRFIASGESQETSEIHSPAEKGIANISVTTVVGDSTSSKDEKSKATPSTRSVTSPDRREASLVPSVCVAKHHRIYVDTPPAPAASNIPNNPCIDSIEPTESKLSQVSSGRPIILAPVDKPRRRWLKQKITLLCFPLRASMGWIWHQLLVIDDVLESCLRCMLLLDPRVQRPGRLGR